MVVGTLGVGQTLVILTAGIDLSNGAVMALGTIVMTDLAVNRGVNPILAILLGILVCGGFGVLNGALVTRLRLPPFIVTLGTLNIAFALTHIYSGEQTITNLPIASDLLRQYLPYRRHRRHLRLGAAVVALPRHLVRAAADRRRPPRLRAWATTPRPPG